MKKFFLLLVVLSQIAFAQSFDFNSKGDSAAGKILKNYIEKTYDIEDIDAIGYFWNDKIVGIVKHSNFYSLEGYKLIVLNNDENNTPIKCDVFFDNTQEIIFNDNKVIFYKSVFYKNKKYSATVKKDEIKTNKSASDILKDRKVQNIEKLTKHSKTDKTNNIELSDFKTNTQRKVQIRYNNLSEKTKHYLDMK